MSRHRPKYRGRPRLPVERRRSLRLVVHLTPYEARILERRLQAADCRSNHQGFFRACILYGVIRAPRVPRANLQIAGQLSRLGSLLNQAVAALHRSREIPPTLGPLLTEVLGALRQYRIALTQS
jgi:hypothetical protein